jgi:hypothetical protein
MDIATRVFKSTLNDERRWVASFGCTGVIRTSVTALGLDVWNSAVLVLVREEVEVIRGFHLQQ